MCRVALSSELNAIFSSRPEFERFRTCRPWSHSLQTTKQLKMKLLTKTFILAAMWTQLVATGARAVDIDNYFNFNLNGNNWSNNGANNASGFRTWDDFTIDTTLTFTAAIFQSRLSEPADSSNYRFDIVSDAAGTLGPSVFSMTIPFGNVARTGGVNVYQHTFSLPSVTLPPGKYWVSFTHPGNLYGSASAPGAALITQSTFNGAQVTRPDDALPFRLTGTPTDTDEDMLPDSVETGTGIYVSPQNTGTSPTNADSDADGLGDWQEVNTCHTNPNVADTDGDGFDDKFEINTGFDPKSAASTPETQSSIRVAAEYRFNGAPGVSYRIEASTDLSTWTTLETPIIGAGGVITRFYSIEGQPKRFFRSRRN